MLFRSDPDGFYFLVDRKKDVIVSGGENIYPVQIEDFMRRFDKVKDVAVIGLPDRRLGEITAAIVEIKEGMECSKEELEEFCLELPRYKRPKEIIFSDIPRNATGKIEKPKLRKMYGADNLVAKEIGSKSAKSLACQQSSHIGMGLAALSPCLMTRDSAHVAYILLKLMLLLSLVMQQSQDIAPIAHAKTVSKDSG